MSKHIHTIQRYLADMIRDAEVQESGRRSILDFAARVRRDTIEEILRFVQSLQVEGHEASNRNRLLGPSDKHSTLRSAAAGTHWQTGHPDH